MAAATFRDFSHERLQRAFTHANQFRCIAHIPLFPRLLGSRSPLVPLQRQHGVKQVSGTRADRCVFLLLLQSRYQSSGETHGPSHGLTFIIICRPRHWSKLAPQRVLEVTVLVHSKKLIRADQSNNRLTPTSQKPPHHHHQYYRPPRPMDMYTYGACNI